MNHDRANESVIEKAAKTLFNRLGRGDWNRVDEWRRQKFRVAATTLADSGLLNERCGAEIELVKGFVRCDYIAGHGQAHSWYGDKQNWCTW